MVPRCLDHGRKLTIVSTARPERTVTADRCRANGEPHGLDPCRPYIYLDFFIPPLWPCDRSPFSCIDAPSSGRSMYSKRARLFAKNVRNPISSRSDARVVVFADSRSSSSSFASRLGRLDDTIAYTEVINFPVPRESKRITRDILRISSRKLMPEACGARQ